jgi:hypothetical protein
MEWSGYRRGIHVHVHVHVHVVVGTWIEDLMLGGQLIRCVRNKGLHQTRFHRRLLSPGSWRGTPSRPPGDGLVSPAIGDGLLRPLCDALDMAIIGNSWTEG